MTTSLGKVASAAEAIVAVMSLPLPCDIAYRVAKLGELVFEEANRFDAQKLSAVRRLGTHIEGTDNFSFEGHNKDAFIAEIDALSGIEVSIESAPISLKSLGSNVVAAKHLLALEQAGLLVDDTKVSQ